MKKIWLTFAGSLLLSLSVMAQERSDTTGTSDPSSNYRRTDTESGTQTETSTIQGKSATQGQSENFNTTWRDEDSESVSSGDLPSGLLETLRSEEYQGWENATIYRNRISEDYMLVIQDNGSTRTFYFDKEGQARNYTDDDQSSLSTETDMSTSETQPSQANPGNNATGATSTSAGTTTPSGASGTPLNTETTITTEQPSTSWRAEDRVVILNSDIPPSLRITLEDDRYRGWENSTIYRNSQTNDYMIEIRDGSNSKIYYFDKDGKALQISGPDDDQ